MEIFQLDVSVLWGCFFEENITESTRKDAKKPPHVEEVKGLNWLVVEPTHLKNMLVKMDHFAKDRGEN